MGCRTSGLSDKWVVGQVGCRTSGLSDKWVVGQVSVGRMGLHLHEAICRTCGLSEHIVTFYSIQFTKHIY